MSDIHKNTTRFALLCTLLVAAIAVPLLVGVGSAAVETDTANFTNVTDDLLVDEQVEVTNDTRSVFVEVTDDGDKAEGPVNATVYEVDSENIQTQVDKVQITAPDNGTELYEYGDDSGETLDTNMSYRVVVEGNSSDVNASAVTVGTVSEVASAGGGGSFSLDGSTTIAGVTVPVVGLVLIVGGVLLYARD